MRLERLRLKNFRLFDELDLKFPDSNFVVLVGINGSGKSSILDAIALTLPHIIRPLSSSPYRSPISLVQNDIRTKASKTEINLFLDIFDHEFEINIAKKIDQKTMSHNIKNRADVLDKIRQGVKKEDVDSLPIMAYYRLNRTIESRNVRAGNHNKILNGYTHAFENNISPFAQFEKWFVAQENIENQEKIESQDLHFELESLKILRQAMNLFLNNLHSGVDFENIRGNRKGGEGYYETKETSEILIDKNGEVVKLEQMSSGEKMVIFLVSDIARRLAILNKNHPDSLNQSGVILIDEIEMHLHPKWQRNIIPALKKVFPNIQFIATTHSPQILSNVSDKDVIFLSDKKHFSLNSNPLGRDSNGILEEIFETTERPQQADELINSIFAHLNNGSTNFEKAELKLLELKKQVADDLPVLLRIENLINRKKILKQ